MGHWRGRGYLVVMAEEERLGTIERHFLDHFWTILFPLFRSCYLAIVRGPGAADNFPLLCL